MNTYPVSNDMTKDSAGIGNSRMGRDRSPVHDSTQITPPPPRKHAFHWNPPSIREISLTNNTEGGINSRSYEFVSGSYSYHPQS